MPDNKFSGSVDQILENLKQQQNQQPASSRAVDDILADLGRGGAVPRPTPTWPGTPRKEAEEPPVQAAVPPAAPARRVPAQQAPEQATASVAPPAPKPAKLTAQPPMPKAPAKPPKSAPVQQPVPEEEPRAPRAVSPVPELSSTVQMDEQFQKFFSESVAVIPDEEPEQHPGFFARFLQRRRDEEDYYETGEQEELEEPTVMIPGKPLVAGLKKKAQAGEELDDTRPIDLPSHTGPIELAGGDTGSIQLAPPAAPQAPSEPTGSIDLSGLDQTGPIDTEPTRRMPEPDEATGPIDLLGAGEGGGRIHFEEAVEEDAPVPRRGFSLPKLFGREEGDEGPLSEELPAEYIEDYADPADAPAVEAELARARLWLGLRAGLSGLGALVLLYLGLSGGKSLLPAISAIDPTTAPSAWLVVQLLVLAVVCAINWRVFWNGVRGIWASPSAESLCAFGAVASLFQLFYLLTTVGDAGPVETTLFCAPAALLLCLADLGRFMMSGVVARNFSLVSKAGEHTAAALVRDRELAATIAKGLDEPQPSLLVNRPAGLVTGFLGHSYSVRASDHLAQKLSWALLGAALVSALICLFTGKGAGLALAALAGTLCLGGPLAATLISALPSSLMQKSAAKVGAVIPGWSAVAQLGQANMAVVEAIDLFPPKSVRLHGIKTFEKQRIDLAILYAASVLVEGCDTLRDVFLNIIQDKTDILFPVENLENHPGLGFSAWVQNNRVLVGGRAMMQAQGVELPSLDYENRYTKGTKQPIYLAVSGRLFGMFLVSYRPDANAAQVLDGLHRQGISVLVRSDDFSLTSELVAALYDLPESGLKVLTAADRKALTPHWVYQRESEGCMVHMGSFASFAGGLTAAAAAAWGERSASLVLAAGVVFSCCLALLLAFTGGLAQLTLPALVLYQAAWCVLALAVPLLKRYD